MHSEPLTKGLTLATINVHGQDHVDVAAVLRFGDFVSVCDARSFVDAKGAGEVLGSCATGEQRESFGAAGGPALLVRECWLDRTKLVFCGKYAVVAEIRLPDTVAQHARVRGQNPDVRRGGKTHVQSTSEDCAACSAVAPIQSERSRGTSCQTSIGGSSTIRAQNLSRYTTAVDPCQRNEFQDNHVSSARCKNDVNRGLPADACDSQEGAAGTRAVLQYSRAPLSMPVAERVAPQAKGDRRKFEGAKDSSTGQLPVFRAIIGHQDMSHGCDTERDPRESSSAPFETGALRAPALPGRSEQTPQTSRGSHSIPAENYETSWITPTYMIRQLYHSPLDSLLEREKQVRAYKCVPQPEKGRVITLVAAFVPGSQHKCQRVDAVQEIVLHAQKAAICGQLILMGDLHTAFAPSDQSSRVCPADFVRVALTLKATLPNVVDAMRVDIPSSCHPVHTCAFSDPDENKTMTCRRNYILTSCDLRGQLRLSDRHTRQCPHLSLENRLVQLTLTARWRPAAFRALSAEGIKLPPTAKERRLRHARKLPSRFLPRYITPSCVAQCMRNAEEERISVEAEFEKAIAAVGINSPTRELCDHVSQAIFVSAVRRKPVQREGRADGLLSPWSTKNMTGTAPGMPVQRKGRADGPHSPWNSKKMMGTASCMPAQPERSEEYAPDRGADSGQPRDAAQALAAEGDDVHANGSAALALPRQGSARAVLTIPTCTNVSPTSELPDNCDTRQEHSLQSKARSDAFSADSVEEVEPMHCSTTEVTQISTNPKHLCFHERPAQVRKTSIFREKYSEELFARMGETGKDGDGKHLEMPLTALCSRASGDKRPLEPDLSEAKRSRTAEPCVPVSCDFSARENRVDMRANDDASAGDISQQETDGSIAIAHLEGLMEVEARLLRELCCHFVAEDVHMEKPEEHGHLEHFATPVVNDETDLPSRPNEESYSAATGKEGSGKGHFAENGMVQRSTLPFLATGGGDLPHQLGHQGSVEKSGHADTSSSLQQSLRQNTEVCFPAGSGSTLPHLLRQGSGEHPRHTSADSVPLRPLGRETVSAFLQEGKGEGSASPQRSTNQVLDSRSHHNSLQSVDGLATRPDPLILIESLCDVESGWWRQVFDSGDRPADDQGARRAEFHENARRVALRRKLPGFRTYENEFTDHVFVQKYYQALFNTSKSPKVSKELEALFSKYNPLSAMKWSDGERLAAKITHSELQAAVDQLDTHSPAGADGVPPVLLASIVRTSGDMAKAFVDLANRAIARGGMPLAWKHGLLRAAPKPGMIKGPPEHTEPVIITQVARRLFEIILSERLRPLLLNLVVETHKGLGGPHGQLGAVARVAHAVADTNLVGKRYTAPLGSRLPWFRQTGKKHRRKHKPRACQHHSIKTSASADPAYVLVVPLDEAFDTLRPEYILKQWQGARVPQNFPLLLASTVHMELAIDSAELPRYLTKTRGASRQDPLTSLLFSTMVDTLLRSVLNWKPKEQLPSHRDKEIVAYEDELAIVLRSADKIAPTLTAIVRTASTLGMKIRTEKCTLMAMHISAGDHAQLVVEHAGSLRVSPCAMPEPGTHTWSQLAERVFKTYLHPCEGRICWKHIIQAISMYIYKLRPLSNDRIPYPALRYILDSVVYPKALSAAAPDAAQSAELRELDHQVCAILTQIVAHSRVLSPQALEAAKAYGGLEFMMPSTYYYLRRLEYVRETNTVGSAVWIQWAKSLQWKLSADTPAAVELQSPTGNPQCALRHRAIRMDAALVEWLASKHRMLDGPLVDAKRSENADAQDAICATERNRPPQGTSNGLPVSADHFAQQLKWDDLPMHVVNSDTVDLQEWVEHGFSKGAVRQLCDLYNPARRIATRMQATIEATRAQFGVAPEAVLAPDEVDMNPTESEQLQLARSFVHIPDELPDDLEQLITPWQKFAVHASWMPSGAAGIAAISATGARAVPLVGSATATEAEILAINMAMAIAVRTAFLSKGKHGGRRASAYRKRLVIVSSSKEAIEALQSPHTRWTAAKLASSSQQAAISAAIVLQTALQSHYKIETAFIRSEQGPEVFYNECAARAATAACATASLLTRRWLDHIWQSGLARANKTAAHDSEMVESGSLQKEYPHALQPQSVFYVSRTQFRIVAGKVASELLRDAQATFKAMEWMAARKLPLRTFHPAADLGAVLQNCNDADAASALPSDAVNTCRKRGGTHSASQHGLEGASTDESVEQPATRRRRVCNATDGSSARLSEAQLDA